MRAGLMNTATYRNMARDAARACRWQDAADLYEKAISVYPAQLCRTAFGDALANRDLMALESKRADCLRMAGQG